jgi:hypothetical protein
LSYLFQYVIFGFTPWSLDFVLILVATSIHNVLASTGLYGDLFRWMCPADEEPASGPAVAPNVERFRRLLETRYTMQVFAQDTIADLWSFTVIVWLVFLMWVLNIPVASILPNFTVEPLTLRTTVLVGIRGLAWFGGQLIFRRKLQALSATSITLAPTTLAQELELYLHSLGGSEFHRAMLRSCYEEDAPELFEAEGASAHVSLADLLLLQIAERQWLLHPALLRKYFLYFHAAMYFLLFVILQSTLQSSSQFGALRYAWFRGA